MHELSLKQLFGEGAFQNETSLIIEKSSLLKLIPKANNTAESLLTAILITALENFQGTLTDSDNNPIVDEFNQAVTYDNSENFELLGIMQWRPFIDFRANVREINHQIIVNSHASN
jgi:hypothetical protein